MQTLFTYRIVRISVLTPALAGLLWLALTQVMYPSMPAQAAGPVTNCTTAGLQAALSGANGMITFNCGSAPVVITLTDNGGLDVIAGKEFTMDGGDKVTPNAAHANRLFDVRVGGALTLSNIILTDGYQDGIHGNLPDLGGAILAEGRLLVLDHVTIRNSSSQTAGGGWRSSPGPCLSKTA